MRAMLKRLAPLLLGVIGTGTAMAAAVSDRSPVRLGLWWDPAAAGTGFELFAAGPDQVLVWYTYREDGAPIWYTASGRFDAAGEWKAPLLKHRFSGDRRVSATAGEVRLRRGHFEKLDLEFDVGARSGRLALVPFPVSGIVPEVDHSGAFYDPARSGFGLSVTEQGESVIAALYFYDAAGEPTWRVGDNGGAGSTLTMRGYRGQCAGCSPAVPTLLDEGRLELTLGANEGRVGARYDGAPGAQWSLSGELRQLSTPASARPADRQLAHFDDEASLRRWLDPALLSPGSYPAVIDFSPPPAMETFSSTNTQEAGVDEADSVDSDGRFVYAFGSQPGSTAGVLRIGETVDGGSLQMHANRPFAALTPRAPQEGMYVHDDRLVLVTGTAPSHFAGSSLWNEYWAWVEGKTRVEILDRANPRVPTSLKFYEFDGHLVASRRIGDRLYLVLRQSAKVDQLAYPFADPANLAANQARIAATPTAALLPNYRVGSQGALLPQVDPKQVYLPVTGALPASPEFITVVGLDLDAPGTPDTLSIAGSVGAVYVSPTRMYLATTRNEARWDPVRGFMTEGLAVTDIHELELGADGPKVAATGSIEGFLDRDVDRAAFRFSEKDGRLRVVSVGSHWGRLGQNRLTVLERSSVSPGLLKTLSYLPNRERPEPIGKPNEQLYGTRFVGDKLYAVTFLRTDPLYVVDVSDPADPAIDGAVELPGYSDYLHPVLDGVLLGVGLDAIEVPGFSGPFALFQGVQLNLFDVSDPAHPRVLQQESIGKRGTQTAVMASHHALSTLRTGAGLDVALPLRVHASLPADSPVSSPFQYENWSWSGLQKFRVTGSSAADARLVRGKALVTHSRALANDPGYDDAAFGARSVQFTRGTIYVERGRYWLADAEGNLMAGPL